MRRTCTLGSIRKGIMMQTSAQEQQQLSVMDAQHLLERQGCEILCRFGHIHATRDVQEWHVCPVADLASMPPSHLLARLDKALKLRVEQSIALSPLTHEEGAKVRRDKQEKSIKKEAL